MNLSKLFDIPVDYNSIVENLDKIAWHPSNAEKNIYYYDYADQFNELSTLSSTLYLELENLLYKMPDTWSLPPKKRKDFEDYTSAYWFDTAALLFSETSMMLLLENEGLWGGDEETERDKRIRALMTLTKEQMRKLLTGVFHFLWGYLMLDNAFQTLCGIIDELEYLHSFRSVNSMPELPPSAYLQ